MKLEGRVAVVTGGGQGIGAAIARAFAREGAHVAVNDLHAETAEKTAGELPGQGHLAVVADVTDSAGVAGMFARIEERHGRVDVLVNNAGVDRVPGDGLDELLSGQARAQSVLLLMSDESWKRMLEIHLNGAFYCTREALRRMLPAKTGSVIQMSSIAGLGGMGTPHYATAKGGLLGLTRALAREVGPRGVRVNAICPGVVDTAMTRALPQAVVDMMVGQSPLRAVGEPEDIAAAAVFLASDDSKFITGQWISPNGGMHMA